MELLTELAITASPRSDQDGSSLTAGAGNTKVTGLLRLLLDENRALRAANLDLNAMLRQLAGSGAPARPFAFAWFRAKRRIAAEKPLTANITSELMSWQDVHRHDTSSWASGGRSAGGTMRSSWTSAHGRDPLSGGLDFGWMRQNAALLHLLRSGQWQPVPYQPPDIWAERLATRSSGITTDAARRILTMAFDVVPQPSRSAVVQPVSQDERAWAQRNHATVRGLTEGQLRGIPTSPSRAWVAAFQSAVGGTMAEIAAILALVVDITHPDDWLTGMVAAE